MRALQDFVRVCALWCVLFGAMAARADAQYQQYERMACPRELINMYIDKASARTGIEYTFRSDWVNASALGLTQAFFDPKGDWWVPLISENRRAAWDDAGLYVSCHKLVYYRSNGTNRPRYAHIQSRVHRGRGSRNQL